jgi:hypothetical protein
MSAPILFAFGHFGGGGGLFVGLLVVIVLAGLAIALCSSDKGEKKP